MYFKLFYFFFYIAIAGYTYINIHLRSLGWDVAYIGVVNSIAKSVALLSFPLWGFLSDMFRANKKMLMIILSIASLLSTMFLFPGNKVYFSILFVLYITFLMSSPQLGDSMVLGALEKQSDYGRYRLWGSIGFTVFVSIIGMLVENTNSKYIFIISAIVLIISLILVGKFPDTDSKLNFPKLDDFKLLFKNVELRYYLLYVYLIFLTFESFICYFPIYAMDNGHGESLVGIAYMIAAASEIAIFYFYANIKKKFGIKTLLYIISGSFAFRWLMLGLFPNTFVILGTQLLHSITFGLFHASSVYYINQMCGLKLKATGQNLYAIFKSLSGILAALIGGYIYTKFSGSVLFYILSGIALLAGVIYIFRGNIIDNYDN